MLLHILLTALLLAFTFADCNAGTVSKNEEGTGQTAFSADWLIKRAKAMSQSTFQPPDAVSFDAVSRLTYDEHRDIRFLVEKALWRDKKLPFEVQFFHPGWVFRHPVRVYEVSGRTTREVHFTPDYFNYGRNGRTSRSSSGLGFAGFRLHYPLNDPEYLDEVIVFLGASYFRAVGQGQHYGITSRGLLIDGKRNGEEEFPLFREFWLERPLPSARHIIVHALLDSPSATGAYTFTVHPGTDTVVDVSATLFARKDVEKIGIAPLTSMYLFGKKDSRFDDFRPEVHDSDGLSIVTGTGERIWRPLANPPKTRVSVFLDENTRGFGLLQRNRNFTDYQDLESRYEQRPSLWVEPLQGWGKGSVRLLEIPSDVEYNDNIVAYWASEGVFKKGEQRSIKYRLHWCLDPPDRDKGGEVAVTSSCRSDLPGARRFVIDFHKGQLAGDAENDAEAVVTASAGEISNIVVQKNLPAGGYRVFFDLLTLDHSS